MPPPKVLAITAKGNYAKFLHEALRMPEPESLVITGIKKNDLDLIYPSNWSVNSKPIHVKARRLEITYVGPKGLSGLVYAFLLNYDRISSSNPGIVFAINGHNGGQHVGASCAAVGFEGGGNSGAPIGHLAVRGYPVLTYDDPSNTPYQQTDATDPSKFCKEQFYKGSDPLSTLLRIRIVDRLLSHLKIVDEIGISGGAERLYHHTLLSVTPRRSAYIAGFFRLVYAFGDDDTCNERFRGGFDWNEFILPELSRGTNFAFASNTGENGAIKAALIDDLLPAISGYFKKYSGAPHGTFEIRGDDKDGDGRPDGGGPPLAHEYDIPDLISWLTKQGWPNPRP